LIEKELLGATFKGIHSIVLTLVDFLSVHGEFQRLCELLGNTLEPRYRQLVTAIIWHIGLPFLFAFIPEESSWRLHLASTLS
jgi:hypothetical protein